MEDFGGDSQSSGQGLNIDGAFHVIRLDHGYATGFRGIGRNGAWRKGMDNAEHDRKSTSTRYLRRS